MVKDMPTMVHYYRDVLRFAVKEGENAGGFVSISDTTS